MDITYKEFIQNILDTRGRFACGDEYCERHHVVPRCMNGSDEKENLIDLYAREHFEAHRLLALENPDNKKLIYAWWMMSTTRDANKLQIKITAEEYEEARKTFSKTVSGENNPWYGKSSPRLGAHLTDEQKQYLREINLGERSPKYGKPTSEETKQKMREARLGKVVSEETKKKLSISHIGKNMGADHAMAKQTAQYGLDGVLIKVWDCISDVARALNISTSAISSACNGKNPTAGGFQFRHVDGEVSDTISPYVNQSGKYQMKTVARCDEDWNIIDVWDGYTAAQNGTGINKKNIGACCNGRRQYAGGYRWKILN